MTLGTEMTTSFSRLFFSDPSGRARDFNRWPEAEWTLRRRWGEGGGAKAAGLAGLMESE